MGQLLRAALPMNNLGKAAVVLASLLLSCSFYLSISASVDYQLSVSLPETSKRKQGQANYQKWQGRLPVFGSPRNPDSICLCLWLRLRSRSLYLVHVCTCRPARSICAFDSRNRGVPCLLIPACKPAFLVCVLCVCVCAPSLTSHRKKQANSNISA